MNRRDDDRWAAVPERDRPPVVGIAMLLFVMSSVLIALVVAAGLALIELGVWLETV